MTAFEVKYRPVIVYADTFADLAAIPADLTLTKHAFILDSGDEYVLEPKSTVWQKLTNAEAAAIAELEAGLEANRIYNTASSAAVCSFSDGADGVPMKSLIAEIAPVQAGSGDPSPDNVRPISGWDGVTVTRTGKNLLPKGSNGSENGITFTVQENGEVVATGTATSTAFWAVQFTLPAGSYTMNGCPSGGGSSNYYIDVRTAKGGSGVAGIGADQGSGSTFTLTAELTAYLNIRITSGYTCPTGGLKLSPMIRPASIADGTFAPYIGQTYPITFPTPPGTVYGGTLDVISGVLTVDGASVDLGSLSWELRTYGSNTAFIADIAGGKSTGNSSQAWALCEAYKKSSTIYLDTAENCSFTFGDAYVNNKSQVKIVDNAYESANSFKTGANGIEFVYELATPITYQLDPVAIASLKGVNNLWSSTGDTSAEYCADPKLYIDNAIASAVAALS